MIKKYQFLIYYKDTIINYNYEEELKVNDKEVSIFDLL